ncbi:MAG: hypothetical protein AAF497_26860, partial [Planctomycetota bacterium]
SESGVVSPWWNPYQIHIAETRKSNVESVNFRYARRIDRVVIPLGKLRIPGGDVDNLCDLRIPYAHFSRPAEVRRVLEGMLAFKQSDIEPGRYGFNAVGLDYSPLSDSKPLYDLDIATLKQLAAVPGERVEIDADTQQIRYVTLDPWYRRVWNWIKTKAP